MRQQKIGLIFLLILCLSVVSGTVFIQLVGANPYWWYTKVPPDEQTKPPVITVISPENNTVFNEDSIVLSFQVETGESKTASDTLLFFVDYTTDWEHNNSDHFAPWSSSSFSHEINLTKIPEGPHTINITTTEMGTYTKTGPNAFLIDNHKTIYFTINTNPQTNQIPEFPSGIVVPVTAVLVAGAAAVFRHKNSAITRRNKQMNRKNGTFSINWSFSISSTLNTAN